MSNNKKKGFSLIRIIPILLILGLILFLTLQAPASTLRVSRILQRLCKMALPDSTGRWTTDMHWFRTLLHLPMYFTLGGIVYLSLQNVSWSVVLCSIVAIADETLKIYLPTREFGALDLVFDFGGFCMGICFLYLIRAVVKKVIDVFS